MKRTIVVACRRTIHGRGRKIDEDDGGDEDRLCDLIMTRSRYR